MQITGPPPPPPAPPPRSRFGRYTLLDRIAVGGMAEVFRAQEPRAAGEPGVVVVKKMLPSLAREPSARAMFAEEARLGGALAHPNVVRVLGSGEEDGRPFLVLEHVPGLDLFRFTRWLTGARRTIGVEGAVFLVRELLAGLEAVHAARDVDGEPLALVHRDVSPSNVLLSVHGDVKLGDFGIAQARLRESFPQAASGDRAKGKLGYLSPEQVRGLPVDRRADVFGAAVIAAELLTGQALFAGGSELAILLAIREADTRRFEERAGTLPAALRAVILAALARDPESRTPTAAAFREALTPWAGVESALRTELAGLVSEGHRARRPSGTHDAASRDHGMAPMPPDDGEEEQTRTGRDLGGEHWVRAVDGRTYGPFNYAAIVEGITTRRIGPDDAVAMRGGPFVPLLDHPELRRHVPMTSERRATRDTPKLPDRTWALEGGGFVEALGSLVVEHESGLLLCEHGAARKEVHLVRGVPEFVSSNLGSELLGEFLVARGVISRGELDMALAVMPRFEGRLGETLTALGLVEPVRLFQQIAAQVQEKLLDVFTWSGGRATFYRGVALPASAFPLGLDPWKLLLEGVERRLGQGLPTVLDNPGGAHVVASRHSLDRGRLPVGVGKVLDASATPIALGALVDSARDPIGRDRHAGRREVALLLAVGGLIWAS